jgi:hypothetical protein
MNDQPRYFISLAEQIDAVKTAIKVQRSRMAVSKRLRTNRGEKQLRDLEAAKETLEIYLAKEEKERNWF